MFERLLAPLLETLRPHFALSKTRPETLAVLLVGLANGRTVNLTHLASQFPGDALHASNYRRLQRFFQFLQSDGDIAARLIVRMLHLERPKLLALDRTNWKLGTRDVNVLVLAIVTRRFRVPLMWVLRMRSLCPVEIFGLSRLTLGFGTVRLGAHPGVSGELTCGEMAAV